MSTSMISEPASTTACLLSSTRASHRAAWTGTLAKAASRTSAWSASLSRSKVAARVSVPLERWVAVLFVANLAIATEIGAVRTFVTTYLVEHAGTTPAVANGMFFVMLVGAFTALFASVVMLTQTSVKRSLAYSTIAQMGFMMLQCGLGAFSLAVLHLVAHSLYKAHAFLSSGGVVELKRSAWTPAGRPSAHPLVLAACLLAAVGATLGIGRLFGIGLSSDPGVVLLGSIFLMALAHLLWSLWADSRGAALALSGVAIALVCSLAYFSLHAASERLLADVLPRFVPDRHPFEYALMAFVALLFLGVLVVQTQLPAWADRPGLRALYVHLSRGLYLGAWSDRATEAIYARLAPQASRTAARG